MTGPTGCSWSVSDNQAWIATTPSRVSDDGRVTVTVGSGSAGQSGTVTIGGRNIPIIVDPCPASPTGVTPTRLTFTAAAGSRDVTVAGPTGCSWPVTASETWTNAAPSASAGSFAITVSANTGCGRSGTVTIGGRRVVITQAAGSSSPPDVTPRSLSFPASGGSQSVTVSRGASCSSSWPVTVSDSWISAGGSASAGSFAITVRANTGCGRSGTVTIGGRRVVITQAGSGSPPDVTPRSLSFPASGGSQSVTVSRGASCSSSWPVTVSDPWISAASTVSAGSFAITVSANTGCGRSGTVTIGGRRVVITQAGSGSPPDVTPRSLSFPASGGSQSVTVSRGASCSSSWTG